MSLLSRLRERSEAEEQARRAERLVLKPVEARLGRLPDGRWPYLCWPAHRGEVAWTDDEARRALSASEDCVLVRVPGRDGPSGLYIYDRRVYGGAWDLTAGERQKAVRLLPVSAFLPIVQIERENTEPSQGNSTYLCSGRPQQLGEPPKFQPVAAAAPQRVRKPIPRDVKMFVWQRDGGR